MPGRRPRWSDRRRQRVTPTAEAAERPLERGVEAPDPGRHRVDHGGRDGVRSAEQVVAGPASTVARVPTERKVRGTLVLPMPASPESSTTEPSRSRPDAAPSRARRARGRARAAHWSPRATRGGRERVAKPGALDGDHAVVAGHPQVQPGDGLVVPAEVTSAVPVITSPGRTGARKLRFSWRNTLPGPGRAGGVLDAGSVVVAAGDLAMPRLPPLAAALPAYVRQLHAGEYRNPGAVDGDVLVVGAGPSGQQIARELAAAGRRVHLAVGRHKALPRRYRGHDTYWWLDRLGLLSRSVASLPGGRAPRRSPNAVLAGGRARPGRAGAGRGGGDRARPAARRRPAAGGRSPTTWPATLATAERNAARFRAIVDAYVDSTGFPAPARRPGAAAVDRARAAPLDLRPDRHGGLGDRVPPGSVLAGRARCWTPRASRCTNAAGPRRPGCTSWGCAGSRGARRASWTAWPPTPSGSPPGWRPTCGNPPRPESGNPDRAARPPHVGRAARFLIATNAT